MRNTRRKLCRLAAIMLTISVTASGMGSGRKQQEIIKADTTDSRVAPQEGITLNKASITSEITGSRNRFTKQFQMSDGTYLAAVYSMPVHYKVSGVSSKDGKWKEINTTLKKASGKKYFHLCGWMAIHGNPAPCNSQNLSASCQPRQKQSLLFCSFRGGLPDSGSF